MGDYWDVAIGLVKIDGLEPSEEFMELVEQERRGEITSEDIINHLNEKYTVLAAELESGNLI